MPQNVPRTGPDDFESIDAFMRSPDASGASSSQHRSLAALDDVVQTSERSRGIRDSSVDVEEIMKDAMDEDDAMGLDHTGASRCVQLAVGTICSALLRSLLFNLSVPSKSKKPYFPSVRGT